MIDLKHINKTFKDAKRNAGFYEALKALIKKEYTAKWSAISGQMALAKAAR